MLKIQPSSSSQEDLSSTFHHLSISTALQGRKVRVVANVHTDDVHEILPIEGGFISGSKDGSLKHWNQEGTLIKDLHTLHGINYRKWITALALSYDKQQWISGSRDGEIIFRSLEGTEQKRFQYNAPKNLGSKERNTHRINCITALSSTKLAIGVAGKFFLLEMTQEQVIHPCQTSPRDWVYSIHRLEFPRLLVTTGTELEIWQKEAENASKTWTKTAIIQSAKNEPKQQRPFISYVTPPLEQKIAAALFDGSIRLYDLTTHQKTATFQEHSGRAWTIAPLTPHTLASGADDGLIKIWDCRQKNSVLTLEGHNGRVSKLLSFREHSLLAASCPNDVLTNAEKATFTFWEIR